MKYFCKFLGNFLHVFLEIFLHVFLQIFCMSFCQSLNISFGKPFGSLCQVSKAEVFAQAEDLKYLSLVPFGGQKTLWENVPQPFLSARNASRASTSYTGFFLFLLQPLVSGSQDYEYLLDINV